jgi:pimeloyl-ACP methyl ester carboxylesterase
VTTVYLHAFPLDERMWQDFEGEAPRLYGRGGSIDGWARELASATLVHGAGAAVVGASMGGYCALRLLAHADVEALVLVGSRAGADPPERRQARIETIRLIQDEGLERLWEVQRPVLFPEDADPEIVERAHALVLGQDPEELATAVAAMRDREDSTPLLRETRARVLIARGEHDPFLSAEEADALAAETRNGRTHTFAGCGHLPSLERPDELRRVVDEFLRNG